MLLLSAAQAQSTAVEAEGSLFSAGLLIGVRGTHGSHALFSHAGRLPHHDLERGAAHGVERFGHRLRPFKLVELEQKFMMRLLA